MTFDYFWHRTLHRPYRLHVIDHGGSGPVIIMLHGIAASSENWRKLVPLLEPKYRCITIDLLGFGKSPKPQWYEYTMEEHVQAVEATIRRLHLHKPFILAGHSLGSLLATRYSRLHPQQVKRLLLLSPPIYGSADSIVGRTARFHTELLLHIYKLLRTHRHSSSESLGMLSRFLPIPKTIATNPDIWIPFTRTLEHCIEQQTILEDITYLKLPIDIFYGSRDQLIISNSILQLDKLDGVAVHKLPVPHDITDTYAAGVAALLIKPKKSSTPQPS